MFEWRLNQQNAIVFVLVDAGGTEVSGLGNTFSLEIAKAGGAFVASAGTKAEIGSGWYSYLTTAAEADTVGPVAVRAWHATTIQQNLSYVVLTRSVDGIPFTYTLTDQSTGLPIEGANVWIATDIAIANVVWGGVTDTFGVARDPYGNLPYLDAGTYYIWAQKTGYTFTVDKEVVV